MRDARSVQHTVVRWHVCGGGGQLPVPTRLLGAKTGRSVGVSCPTHRNTIFFPVQMRLFAFFTTRGASVGGEDDLLQTPFAVEPAEALNARGLGGEKTG